MTQKIDKYDEQRMKDDAKQIQDRSVLLLEESKFTYDLIIKFTDKYTEDFIDSLPWDEREIAYKQCDQLVSRLQILDKELKKLDTDYNAIRTRINTYYNKEVMPQVKLDIINFDFLDDDDEI